MSLFGRNINMADASQQALAFLTRQTTIIEPGVYKRLWPEMDFESLIPVVTDGNPWATTVTFFSMDEAGQAKWFSGGAKDMPFADVDRNKFEHPIAMAGIGYQYNLEELMQAQMAGINITSDKAEAARKASRKFLYDLAITGDGAKGWKGFVNQTGVPTGFVAGVDAAARLWSGKTGVQVHKDMVDAMIAVHTGSNTVETADTILMPVAALMYISTAQYSSSSDLTILEYFMRANPYTALTGRAPTVRAVRALDHAGTGGVGRMVVYTRDPSILKFHLPMPHQFLPAWQTGPMIFDIPGIMRSGGVDVRRPNAMRYVDGITPA